MSTTDTEWKTTIKNGLMGIQANIIVMIWPRKITEFACGQTHLVRSLSLSNVVIFHSTNSRSLSRRGWPRPNLPHWPNLPVLPMVRRPWWGPVPWFSYWRCWWIHGFVAIFPAKKNELGKPKSCNQSSRPKIVVSFSESWYLFFYVHVHLPFLGDWGSSCLRTGQLSRLVVKCSGAHARSRP